MLPCPGVPKPAKGLSAEPPPDPPENPAPPAGAEAQPPAPPPSAISELKIELLPFVPPPEVLVSKAVPPEPIIIGYV